MNRFKKLDNKKILIIASTMGVLLLVLVISYAWFNYAFNSEQNNSIASGEIKFHYAEENSTLSLQDAMPIPDSEGKTQNEYFDFSVTGTTGNSKLSYEITARKMKASFNIDNSVKLYLTKLDGTNEEEKLLSIYSDLSQSTNELATNHTEKTIATGIIPAESIDYTDNYRLRMWLNNDINDGNVVEYTQSETGSCSNSTYTTEDTCIGAKEDWTSVASSDFKTFTVKINVYTIGELVSDQEVIDANSTEIESLTINDITAQKNLTDSNNFDYLVESLETYENAFINVIPKDRNATYTIEQISEETANNIKQIANKNTFSVDEGDNYFKIAVTSANRRKHQDYVLKFINGLHYRLITANQNNNSVTVNAGESIELTMDITSINSINSKYEIYYTTSNDSVEVGYGKRTANMPNGELSPGETKNITIIIKNKTSSAATITFDATGQFITNDIVLASGKHIDKRLSICNINANTVWNYNYTGGQQSLKLPCDGRYKLEVWGAQGGNSGGYGGYSTGTTTQEENTIIYVNVGGAGVGNKTHTYRAGGYNGGGNAVSNSDGNTRQASGGGATHMATASGVLSNLSGNKGSILIVAGGGGGAGGNSAIMYNTGGAGGGLTGGNSGTYRESNWTSIAYGGTQTAGGSASRSAAPGGFGYGGSGVSAGGGGGYYGGGAGTHAGAGGSGYVGGVTSGSTSAGQRSGNGYARITYLGD